MIAGDGKEWRDFVDGGGISTIIELTLAAWEKLKQSAPPTNDEEETSICLRLVRFMLKLKKPHHRFLVRYEDIEVELDVPKEKARKDIIFYITHDEALYFCWEAKRLGYREKNKRLRSNADQYIKEGMQNFVDGRYSREVHHAGMLGYVLDGNIPIAMRNVLSNIRAGHLSLGMAPPGDWDSSRYRPQDPNMKETEHERKYTQTPLQLQHLFLTAVAPQPRGKPGPKPKQATLL